MVLDSFLVDMIYHTERFANVEPPLHPRGEFHLVMLDNPFNVLLDLLARILLRILAPIFIRDISV